MPVINKNHTQMKTNKLLSGSFWLIMAIHLIVFTAIGLFTVKGWRMLLTFLSGLAILFLVVWLLNIYSKRHPEKKKLAIFISVLLNTKTKSSDDYSKVDSESSIK
jgi:cyanate permease